LIIKDYIFKSLNQGFFMTRIGPSSSQSSSNKQPIGGKAMQQLANKVKQFLPHSFGEKSDSLRDRVQQIHDSQPLSHYIFKK
jgi:hypothetical protein